jgi:hypothetical protein
MEMLVGPLGFDVLACGEAGGWHPAHPEVTRRTGNSKRAGRSRTRERDRKGQVFRENEEEKRDGGVFLRSWRTVTSERIFMNGLLVDL